MHYYPSVSSRNWIAHVADAMLWFWKNYGSASRRKEVSHLGAHLADYLVTEVYCRGGSWIKRFTCVGNATYEIILMETSRRDQQPHP